MPRLCADGVLVEPILYLSLHFKEHRRLYYDLLQDVRLKGDWERWCVFFLDGVTATAVQTAHDAKLITDLLEPDRTRIGRIGKASKSALKIHACLLKKPYLAVTKAAAELHGLTPNPLHARVGRYRSRQPADRQEGPKRSAKRHSIIKSRPRAPRGALRADDLIVRNDS